jgi:hypothetical protein
VRAAEAAPLVLDGRIGSVGFASGHRFVVGLWDRGPLGPMSDVMWAFPDGERRLLAPTGAVAELVASVYRFDAVEVVPFTVWSDPTRVELRAGPVRVLLLAGRAWPVFGPRPRWFTRRIEGPLARRLLGVETYGVSSGGRPEWYQARSVRWLLDARATVDGRDQGRFGPVRPPVGVGFSEPPARPSLVRLRTQIGDRAVQEA